MSRRTCVAVAGGVDQDVRGQRRHPGRDVPDVQVVDLGDAGPVGHGRADQVRVEALRGAFEEDPAGLPDQAVPGLDHQRGHDQRGEGVGAGEPGEHDDEPGDRGGDERVEVVEDVLERALDVQAGPVGLADQPGRGDVDHDADQRGDEHQQSLHLRRVEQPPDGLVDEPGREQQQGEPVGLGGEDLGAFEPVGPAALRGPGGQVDRPQGQHDGRGVGEHVPGIGDQRQGLGDDPDNDLGGHERHDQRQRPGQVTLVGVRVHPVRMPVPTPVGMSAGAVCRRAVVVGPVGVVVAGVVGVLMGVWSS